MATKKTIILGVRMTPAYVNTLKEIAHSQGKESIREFLEWLVERYNKKKGVNNTEGKDGNVNT